MTLTSDAAEFRRRILAVEKSAAKDDSRSVSTPYALASYSEKNQERILAQCPHATGVRNFYA